MATTRVVRMTEEELEKFADSVAHKVMAKFGIVDAEDVKAFSSDMVEVRDLLGVYRKAKDGFWSGIGKALGTGIFLIITAGIGALAMKSGILHGK